ncbi:MAG: DUF2279 domain-containing protein [Bacteroidetes bacterium]|nr:DUF2279 domain-containing protein [Bacteroidota bacterium]
MILTILSAALIPGNLKAENSDSTGVPRWRKPAVWSIGAAGIAGTHTFLYSTWYSKYPKSKFHWLNDNAEWLQMDKAGHAWWSYFMTVNGASAFRYAGYNRQKSALYAAGITFAFQGLIEWQDGRSAQWGASAGDLVANTAGVGFALWQSYRWGRPRIPFRISFRATPIAPIRPTMFGSTFAERVLKDYNGQTYWVDLNPQRMQVRPGWWPKWLGFSVGYGANGMLGGHDNVWVDDNGLTHDYSSVARYRQYFISPSISFGYVQSRNSLVRFLCFVTDRVRIPMPALEFNKPEGVRFHPVYW